MAHYAAWMVSRRFRQVDVFGTAPFRGNPVAVVVDGDGLADEAMSTFTRWTNLSEATFILPPRDPRADYRLRIFTATRELPFAGHPTLGSAHAWLDAGGMPANQQTLVQECAGGLVEVRRDRGRLAFAAPPLVRKGAVAAQLAGRVADGLGVGPDQVRAMQWVDNGPGWIGVQLDSASSVLGLSIDKSLLDGLDVGVIGPHAQGGPAEFEVRAFFSGDGILEDPVTGSLNASLAQWLIGTGVAPSRYRVRQGTAVGREGIVEIEHDGERVWVRGTCTTCIEGLVHF